MHLHAFGMPSEWHKVRYVTDWLQEESNKETVQKIIITKYIFFLVFVGQIYKYVCSSRVIKVCSICIL